MLEHPLGWFLGYTVGTLVDLKKFTGVKSKDRPNRLQGSPSLFNADGDPWSQIDLTLVLLPVSFFFDTVLWAGPGINFT